MDKNGQKPPQNIPATSLATDDGRSAAKWTHGVGAERWTAECQAGRGRPDPTRPGSSNQQQTLLHYSSKHPSTAHSCSPLITRDRVASRACRHCLRVLPPWSHSIVQASRNCPTAVYNLLLTWLWYQSTQPWMPASNFVNTAYGACTVKRNAEN